MSIEIYKLKFHEKLGYGFGDFASVLFWQSITANLMFFYTDVFKISSTAKAALIAGTMLGFSRIFDAVIDPGIGMVADRTDTRWGKFRPYLVWFALPLAVAAVAMFTTPNFSEPNKVIYAYITLFLFMFFYAAINIPYSSLLGVLTPDPTQRTSLSSFKFACAYTAGTVVSITALPLAQYFGNGVNTNDPAGWQRTVMLYAGLAVVFFMATFLLTKERVKPQQTQKTSVGRDLLDLVTNGPWVLLVIATLAMMLFVATRVLVTNYYFKYYVVGVTGTGQDFINWSFIGHAFSWSFAKVTSVFQGVNQAFSLIGTLLVPFVAIKFGKKQTFLTLFVVSALACGIFYLLKPQQIAVMLAFQALYSIASGPLSPLIWAMYADAADYAEWKNGRRATGLVFSASATSQKAGWAIGTLFTGLLLSSVGYVSDAIPTPAVSHMILVLMSLVPAAFGIISAVCILFYRLDETTMKQIALDLLDRRKAAGEQA
jgi:glycoside/pentoside/hexuronide:cation symporter, GPH family